jgi:hypothetical protein
MLAQLAVALQEATLAAQFLGVALNEFRALGTTPTIVRPHGAQRLEEEIDALLGATEAETLYTAGSHLSLDLAR